MSEQSVITVFLPNWIGDVVMATPTLRALREGFAGASILHVGRMPSLQVLEGAGLSDATLAEESASKPGFANLLRTAMDLRERRTDMAVLLPNSFRSAAIAWLGVAARIIGYSRDLRGLMLTDRLYPQRNGNGRYAPLCAIDYYAAIAARLGMPCDSRRMVLAATEPYESQATALLAETGAVADRPLVMLNPGAAFGTSKLWAPERFAAVADALMERRGAQIIINAAPAERRIASQVAQAMRHKPLLNFAERSGSIGLLKSLTRRCRLMITNDTGARHIAAAFGIGVVTIFGSTDPKWTAIDYPRERIIRVNVPCSPCQRKLCPQPPGPRYHQCMAAITPDMVLAAAEELLDGDGGIAPGAAMP